MRPSNKSRNRNKNNNRRGSAGNNINRVFESAGPEGRVRGTPQQIIDKYLSLTYDSQLSGDRVGAENFQQHAEHYSRLLIEAQKEIAEKQLEQNLNAVANKTNAQLPEEISDETSSEPKTDKQEDTVVKFGKNLEKNIDGAKQTVEKEKLLERPAQRKIVKKRVSVDTETLKV
ncbi:MAG: DUF4167 domain-containing protein [Paracoccaceae bacterium]|nr:DUF4167 domain-containing protein [Paracoccaceae bacterium]